MGKEKKTIIFIFIIIMLIIGYLIQLKVTEPERTVYNNCFYIQQTQNFSNTAESIERSKVYCKQLAEEHLEEIRTIEEK